MPAHTRLDTMQTASATWCLPQGEGLAIRQCKPDIVESSGRILAASQLSSGRMPSAGDGIGAIRIGV